MLLALRAGSDDLAEPKADRPGPLRFSGDNYGTFMESIWDGPYAAFPVALVNASREDLVIDAVHVVDQEGGRITRVTLLPPHNPSLAGGVLVDWPARSLAVGEDLGNLGTVPVAGYTIPGRLAELRSTTTSHGLRADASNTATLVMRIDRSDPSETARFRGIVVEYHIGRSRYRLRDRSIVFGVCLRHEIDVDRCDRFERSATDGW